MRQEFLNPAGRLFRQPLQYVVEVGIRIVAVVTFAEDLNRFDGLDCLRLSTAAQCVRPAGVPAGAISDSDGPTRTPEPHNAPSAVSLALKARSNRPNRSVGQTQRLPASTARPANSASSPP